MSRPLVSVIITSYHAKAKPYLDLCVRSVLNLNWPRELLEVLIVAPRGYKPQYESAHTISPPEDEYFNSHALNYGAKAALGEYLLMTNDDCIFSRDSLTELVNASKVLGDRAAICPIGNDNQLGMYALDVGVPMGPARLKDWAPIADQMMRAKSPYPMGFFFAQALCLYAALMPRKLFEAIGDFDTSRKGHDDIDMGLRMSKAGYLNAVCLSSLVYHFGGVSADETFSEKDRQESLESFNAKWANETA